MSPALVVARMVCLPGARSRSNLCQLCWLPTRKSPSMASSSSMKMPMSTGSMSKLWLETKRTKLGSVGTGDSWRGSNGSLASGPPRRS